MSNRPARRTAAARNMPQVGQAVHVKSSRSSNVNSNGTSSSRRHDSTTGPTPSESTVSQASDPPMSLSGSASVGDCAVESLRLLLVELLRYQTARAGESQPSSPRMPLQPSQPAPDFKGTAVVDGEFKDIKLSDYKGKYLILFFYPLDFTFVCPTEIIAFSDRSDEFRKINCEVVGCSTDSHFSHLAWVNTSRKMGGLGEMKIPLLADKTCQIARSYGVLKEDEGVAFRGLFIIDGNGTLRQMTVNDMPVGRSVDETLRLVQAFQFTDKHGEVCPAGWKPGSKTMKPDVKNSKEFFQAQ